MSVNRYTRGKASTARACVLPLLFFAYPALANPTGATVVHGTVSFAINGNTLNITNSPNSIINWQSFSINKDEITRFIQQNGASAVLNRVTGQDPSKILGTLQSNGRVFLINPNGIVFGKGATIDVAGLVASTLKMSDADFLSGKHKFGDGSTAGSIKNEGTISTATGGNVYLIAPDIENNGIITSPKGEIVLAAGHTVSLVDPKNPEIVVSLTAPATQAVNVGQLVAQGGSIGIYAGLVNQTGTISADSASIDATGNIVLKATQRTTLAADSVTSATGDQGGSIQVLGNAIDIGANALLDASGVNDGGTILIGGDAHGANPDIPNAQNVTVAAGARIKADAELNGDGGKVIVWSDDTTLVYGNISARGGDQGGDGGFIETSGKRYLDVTQAADASAPNGLAGTWLLDPRNVTIQAAAGNLDGQSPNFSPGADNSTIANTIINTALDAGTNVVIDTGNTGTQAGDINVNAAITKSAGGNASLTLNAANNINLNADITSSVGALDVFLVADFDASGAGATVLGNATVSLNGGVLNIAGTATKAGGVTTLNSDAILNNLIWTGASIAGSGTTTVNGTLTMNGVGALSGHRLTLNGASTLSTVSQLRVDSGSLLTNNGAIDLAGDALINQFTGTGSTINNNGSITKSAGTGNSQLIATTINNNGTISAQMGTVTVLASGSGAHSGIFAVASGATIQFAGGNQIFGNTSQINGAGTIFLGTGSKMFNGAWNHTGAITTGGGVTAVETFNTTNALNVASLNASSNTLIFNSSLTAASVSLVGSPITANAPLTFGTVNWTGATLSGAGGYTVTGPLTIQAGSGPTLNGATLTAQGNTTLTGPAGLGNGGSFRLNNGARFINQGTFNIVDDVSILQNAGTAASTFDNAGLLTLNVPGGTVAFGSNIGVALNFNNTGTVQSQAGTLRFDFDGAHSGIFDVASGATIQFQRNHTFSNTSQINGGGTYVLSGGNRTFSGAWNHTGNLTAVGGFTAIDTFNTSTPINVNAFQGSNTFVINAPFAAASASLTGSMTANAPVTFGSVIWGNANLAGAGGYAVTGPMTIQGQNAPTLTGATLTALGNTTLTTSVPGAGSLRLNDGATFINQGNFDFNSDVFVVQNANGAASTFINQGVVSKSGGTGTSGFGSRTGVALNFNNAGAVQAQAGTLRFDFDGVHSGSFDVSSAATIQFQGNQSFTNTSQINGLGTYNFVSGSTLNFSQSYDYINNGVITGTGTINLAGGALINFGTIRPGTSPGALTILGNLVLMPSSVLDIELGGVGQGAFDVLNVNGNASLAGTLNALQFGGYVPNAGDSFAFLNATSLGGTFGVVLSPAAFTVTPSYTANSVGLIANALSLASLAQDVTAMAQDPLFSSLQGFSALPNAGSSSGASNFAGSNNTDPSVIAFNDILFLNPSAGIIGADGEVLLSETASDDLLLSEALVQEARDARLLCR